jgi:hypothetical protein
MASWNEKGHKADCKLLRDEDFRLLLHLEPLGFDNHRVFSSGYV